MNGHHPRAASHESRLCRRRSRFHFRSFPERVVVGMSVKSSEARKPNDVQPLLAAESRAELARRAIYLYTYLGKRTMLARVRGPDSPSPSRT